MAQKGHTKETLGFFFKIIKNILKICNGQIKAKANKNINNCQVMIDAWNMMIMLF